MIRKPTHTAPPGRSGRTPRHFAADSGGGHVFTAGKRRVESEVLSPHDALIVVLSGVYHARWRESDRWRHLTAWPGEVVYRAGNAPRFERTDPRHPLAAVVLYFRWTGAAVELPPKVSDRLALIRTLGEAMLGVQDAAGPRKRLIENGYLAAALAEICRLAEHEGEDLAARLTRQVYDNLREPLRLEDLAQRLEMSPRRLQREFRTRYGQTPMRAVRRIRVEAAVRLLIQSPARTLKDAAMRTGIANEQELSRMIKQQTGLTAGQLRAKSGSPGAERRSSAAALTAPLRRLSG